MKWVLENDHPWTVWISSMGLKMGPLERPSGWPRNWEASRPRVRRDEIPAE